MSSSPGGGMSPSGGEGISKMRSNSLTFGAQHQHQAYQQPFPGQVVPQQTANQEDQAVIDEMVRRLPEGSGMRGEQTPESVSWSRYPGALL